MAITTEQHQTLLAVRDDLLDRLRTAQRRRASTDELVDGEPAWVGYERQEMRNGVNRWRSRHGLPLVAMAGVEQVERQAVGHVDYTQKLALYCAELACGITSRELGG